MSTTAAAVGPTTAEPGRRPLLLDAYAARSCPVKTQHLFEPGATRPAVPEPAPDDPAAVRAEQARRHRAVVLEALIARCAGRVVDLRLLAADGPDVQGAATRRAMADGVAVVVGPVLPVDVAGHRVGAPDLLVRGDDTPAGCPGYHPVLVKGHLVAQPARPAAEDEKPAALLVSTLEHPGPASVRERPGWSLRLRAREPDLRQLAHAYRMLEAAGHAPTAALGAVIGVDQLDDGPFLCWADRGEPALRTFAADDPRGWRQASVLERYDAALARRLRIARAAATGRRPLVEPVVVRECASCPWWARCRARLDDQDVSLRIDRGALDRREVEALRTLGAGTVPALAAADLDALLPRYLPEVAHRSSGEARLRTAVRRARMLVGGSDFAQETTGPIAVPGAAVEVDFDLETSADGRIYLWGFRVERPAEPGSDRYVAFARFADLDEAAETALAVEALTWLWGVVEAGDPVVVYHYSGFEVNQIATLARRSDDPALAWARAYAEEHFVDLLEVVQQHWFGVHGLGLKLIAAHAGFRWRDDDPGGLNSQRWFADAVHGADDEGRRAARQRVLDYNEDDVRATRALRAWLRDQR